MRTASDKELSAIGEAHKFPRAVPKREPPGEGEEVKVERSELASEQYLDARSPALPSASRTARR